MIVDCGRDLLMTSPRTFLATASPNTSRHSSSTRINGDNRRARAIHINFNQKKIYYLDLIVYQWQIYALIHNRVTLF